MKDFLNDLKRKDHPRYLGGMDFLKYIGPGLLVTVGFIDPGNWASNLLPVPCSVIRSCGLSLSRQ